MDFEDIFLDDSVIYPSDMVLPVSSFLLLFTICI